MARKKKNETVDLTVTSEDCMEEPPFTMTKEQIAERNEYLRRLVNKLQGQLVAGQQNLSRRIDDLSKAVDEKIAAIPKVPDMSQAVLSISDNSMNCKKAINELIWQYGRESMTLKDAEQLALDFYRLIMKGQ